jgi:sn-glycerol 3-phosphate transport system substrate-binding protein
MKTKWWRATVAMLALTAILAACGGGDDDDSTAGGNGGSGGGGGNADLPECPLDALEQASGPVEISFWHAMTRENLTEITRLTDEYNASQSKVHVTLSESPSYTDNLTRYTAGLGTGELPDLVQIEDTGTQLMIDSQSVLPAASCIAADNLDTSDIVPRVLAYYTVQDVLYPMPFNTSNPVLYYDKNAFTQAGLDPEKPPTTLEELRAASQAIVDSGAAEFGFAFKIQPWFLEHWLAMAGETYVNNGNGRNDRATAMTIDNETGVEIYTWLKGMSDDGLLYNTGSAEGNYDHLLAIGNGKTAMTIETSAALGTIFTLLGNYPDVKLGVAPMPGPKSPDGGLLVGGAALYIVNKSAPEKQAAAYDFAKWLAQPEQQSEWAAATGYVPVSQEATTLEPLVTTWANRPELKVAYDQLLGGAENDATAGPVIGPYGSAGQGVRGAVIDSIDKMFSEGTAPADAVKEASDGGDAALEEYNSRVG